MTALMKSVIGIKQPEINARPQGREGARIWNAFARRPVSALRPGVIAALR
jgi:hypothetical protein